jgi:CRISPR-associated endonuclease Cas1
MDSMSKTKGTTNASALTEDDASDGQEAIRRAFRGDSLIPSVAVVDGCGCHVGVSRGELLLRDGLSRYRRERRYPKVGSGLRRVLIMGDASITTAALRWCASTGAAVAIVGSDTRLLATSASGVEDARIRRQQALAAGNEMGLAIAKMLLGAKVRGQARIAGKALGRPDVAQTIDAFALMLEAAQSVDECRNLEATSAEIYWRAWAANPATALRFARTDVSKGRIPARWSQFDGRRSFIGSSNANKRSERPLNSLLNLGYRLAEIEVRLQCFGVGVDPAFGVVHLDRAGRDGMVLDVLEVARPIVEAFILDLVAERAFGRSDFYEAPDGAVRVLMPLSHDLAAAMPLFGKVTAPYVEKVRNLLATGVETKITRSNSLTGAARRAAAAKVKARKAAQALAAERGSERAIQHRPSVTASRLAGCVDCGAPITKPRRVRCDSCVDADPRQTPELRGRRAAAISSRRRAEAEWEEANPGQRWDPDYFAREIQPRLGAVRLLTIVEACGVSKATASTWRSGEWRPHTSHWVKLAELTGSRVV